MTLREHERRARKHDSETLADDLLHGGEAIARELGIELSQLYYGFEQGHYGTAVRKLGLRKLVASRRKLRELFSGEPA
jgi:hypothetical protein